MASVKIPEGYEVVPENERTSAIPEGYEAVPQRSLGDKALGAGAALNTGLVNKAVANVAGLPVDAYNLSGEVMQWAAEKLGLPFEKTQVYPGSSQWFKERATQGGYMYEPQSDLERGIERTAEPIGTALLTAGPKNPMAFGRAATTGAAAPVGGTVAKGANNLAEQISGVSLPDGMADLIGQMIAGAAGGSLGPGAPKTATQMLRDKPSKADVAADYQAAGVTPRLPSDLTGEVGGTQAMLTTGMGGANVSRSMAKQTVDELTDYADRILRPHVNNPMANQPSLADAGLAVRDAAKKAVEKMSNDITVAKQDFNKILPGNQHINIDRTKQAIDEFMNRVKDPDLRDLVNTEFMAKIGALRTKAALTFDEVDDILRNEVGSKIGNASTTGTEQGLLKQMYKAINDDLRDAAATVPGGTEAFAKYKGMADDLRSAKDSILNNVLDEAKTPEQMLQWVAAQRNRGATRLSDTEQFASGAPWGRFSDAYKAQIAGNGRTPDIESALKRWNALPDETRDIMFGGDAANMGRLSRLWEMSEPTRRVAGSDIQPTRATDMGTSILGYPAAKLQPWYTQNLSPWLEQNINRQPMLNTATPVAANAMQPEMPSFNSSQEVFEWADRQNPEMVIGIVGEKIGQREAQLLSKSLEQGPKAYRDELNAMVYQGSFGRFGR